jgi:Na+-translocating ferredoxin:NAD+ oxidoreductase subunit B
MDVKRRDFLRTGSLLIAGGSLLEIMQSCSKNGVSPYKTYAVCDNTCVGCGDCYDVCKDQAVILPQRSFYQINQERCTTCGKCVNVCSYKAIKVAVRSYELDEEKCMGCGKCLEVCASNGAALTWEKDYYAMRGKCKPAQCGTPCISVCPENALALVGGKMQVDMTRCNRCGKCIPVCPLDAINPAKVQMDETKCTQCGKCFTACQVNAFTAIEPQDYVAPHIDAELCQLCGACRTACPDSQAIDWSVEKAVIDKEKCSGCGNCLHACTFDAIRTAP